MTYNWDESGGERPAAITVRPAPSANGRRRKGLYRRRVKRWLDVAGVLAVLPVAAPLIAFFALLVRLDGGPSFYSQLRVGRGGSTFRLWKLRTMVIDADERLEAHLRSDPAARIEWDVTQKLKHDPRVTPVGRFLRRSSLDELPQLGNVLLGDMSLVGPRPMLPTQREDYSGHAYYELRPGLTGPWQVTTRHESSFAQRAVFDNEYGQKISLLTDLRLLMKTVVVVFQATGR